MTINSAYPKVWERHNPYSSRFNIYISIRRAATQQRARLRVYVLNTTLSRWTCDVWHKGRSICIKMCRHATGLHWQLFAYRHYGGEWQNVNSNTNRRYHNWIINMSANWPRVFVVCLAYVIIGSHMCLTASAGDTSGLDTRKHRTTGRMGNYAKQRH